jgi:hypothetical protein
MALSASPLLAGAMRAQPLPEDVLSLIQMAAGDREAIRRAVAVTGATADRVRAAGVLYIQHVVFAPNADHYRTLAVPPDAPHAVLREHVGWLMKWLHPDRASTGWESVFAQRVLTAWNDLKTPQKRARYDASLPPPLGVARTPSGRRRLFRPAPRRVPLIARHSGSPSSPGWRRVAVYVLAGALVAIIVLAAPLAGLWEWFGSNDAPTMGGARDAL